MTEQQAPTLDTDLKEGHSRECLNLDIRYYNNLKQDIDDVREQVMTSLEWVMEIDIDFADIVDYLMGKDFGEYTSYSNLVQKVATIQRLLRESSLNDTDKQRFWKPIANCYLKVQQALKEKITPLEEREIVNTGNVITVKVFVYSHHNGRKGFIAKVPYFKYAIQRYSESGYPYRESLDHLTFQDRYSDSLPKAITAKLPFEGVIELPLRVVSMRRYELNFAEIDEETFLQTQSESEGVV